MKKTLLLNQIYTTVYNSESSGKVSVEYTMQFITGTNRQQTFFGTPDDQVAKDNPVRLIDAFVDKPDLLQPGFINTQHKSEGRPPFVPGVLLKLHMYGYLNKIRSSRKLERECARNIELQWLLKQLVPNYHTIADFRKMLRYVLALAWAILLLPFSKCR